MHATRPSRRWLPIFAGLAASFASLAGCADGLVPEVRSLNPWIRQQWAQDEQFGPTYHRKVADLAALRSSSASLAAPEQERVALELAKRLQDEQNPVLRSELVRTMGALASPTAISTIQASLTDQHPQVRIAACRALGRNSSEENAQALGNVLTSDSDLDVRIAAARALGQLTDPAAIGALRPALDDNDAGLQLVAMESLRTLTGRGQYGNHVPTWREYLDGGDPSPPPGPSLVESLRKYSYW
ncbi:MAG: HEAT repeat domain-containing protein [Pirellulaceae bacterium]|nr:HEAT repeat domain-containing protein [Pirellulaceae bacterium]